MHYIFENNRFNVKNSKQRKDNWLEENEGMREGKMRI